MSYDEVAAFMAELQSYTSISSKALRILILTATRTSEVLRSEWPESDLDNETWTIPADRLKARCEHRVPLPRPAVTLLSEIPRVKGNPYVFPGARYGRPLSNMAMLQRMRGMGYGLDGKRGYYVPNGFMCPMASARAFGIGPVRSPATPATWPKWRWPTPSRTRWRPPTAEATCSRKGGR